jgi:cellulase (glycosyl hydrolase family 5)
VRFSSVVALGLVCLGTFLGLAACGGGSSGKETHAAGASAPQGEMRAPQSRREQSRRTAAASRARARKAAAARARAEQARRRALAAAHKPHVALPPAAAVRAASLPTPALPEPLLLGFQDDVSFRWSADRQRMLAVASSAGARVLRTNVYWWQAAPTRPADARDPFDPAYRFADLDELLRNAQLRGLRILLTIWGTPAWANGGAGHNHAPTDASDLGDFAHAVAARYSGTHAGYPYVPYYSVWNEPNLGQFLVPQYDGRGRPVAPAIYARLYRAAYAGIKSASPAAAVAIGETSPRGRDYVEQGISQTESPGRFAQLLARQRPRLRFDAWAHHPYPTSPSLPPTQIARWPNVTLSQLPRFEAALRTWFGRSNVPVWITEYAYQTSPPASLGVSYARQAAYLRRALTMAASHPWVRMLVWFTFRDTPGNAWESGLLTGEGARKPGLAAFRAAADAAARRNAIVRASSRARLQRVRLPAMRLAYYSGVGSHVSVTYRIYSGRRLVALDQVLVPIERDGSVIVPLSFRPARGRAYTLRFAGADEHGHALAATRRLVAAS